MVLVVDLATSANQSDLVYLQNVEDKTGIKSGTRLIKMRLSYNDSLIFI